jgi:DNA-binding transcriptional LysR family regulator
VPRVVQEADEFFTVLNLVYSGLGVSIVPSAVRLMRVPKIRFAESYVVDGRTSWATFDPEPRVTFEFGAL